MCVRRLRNWGGCGVQGAPRSGLGILCSSRGRQVAALFKGKKKSTGVSTQYLSSNKSGSADLLVREF